MDVRMDGISMYRYSTGALRILTFHARQLPAMARLATDSTHVDKQE